MSLPPLTDHVLATAAACDHCGRPVVLATYADLGRWEPDYDPSDDPCVWRHTGTGYAGCHMGGGTFAAPAPPTPPPPLTLRGLATRCHANSAKWFPSNHLTERAAVTHCTLGLAGEAG